MEILVADNNRTVTRVVRMALEDEGYSVKVANSPAEVRKIISRSLPDIILLDTKFEKDKDGYKLAEGILKKHKDAKIVMLISALEKPDVELAKKLGISGFLTKPVDSRKLFQIISEIQEEEEKRRKKVKDGKKKIEEETHGGEEEKTYGEEHIQGEMTEEEVKTGEEVKVDEVGEEFDEGAGKLGAEEEISDEKKDISFEWGSSRASEIANEVFILLEGVKEMFGSVKSIKEEAEGYVREISQIVDSLRKKVDEIPESEKILSQILTEVVNVIEPRLKNHIEDIAERKIKELVLSLKEEIIGEVKRFASEELKLSVERNNDFIMRRVEDELRRVESRLLERIDESRREVDAELAEVKEKLGGVEQKLGGMEKKLGEIDTGYGELTQRVSGIESSLESLKSSVKSADESAETVSLPEEKAEEIDMPTDVPTEESFDSAEFDSAEAEITEEEKTVEAEEKKEGEKEEKKEEESGGEDFLSLDQL